MVYIVGIMFGEYKKQDKISLKLETEFYKYTSRHPSFGVFLSFLRIISKELPESIINKKLSDKNFDKIPDFVLTFDLLKKVINEGANDDFELLVEKNKKGRNSGKKTIIQFYDSFITIRNIYAHPEDKAGTKDNKRKWPLNSEYYGYINPFLEDTLCELIVYLENIFVSFSPSVANKLDDIKKLGEFTIESNGESKRSEIKLDINELRKISTNNKYLIDKDFNIYSKFYFNSIPQLNASVAKQIINKEKAKAMEPYLKEMIKVKLEDDGKIDEMEYLIIRDTAKTSHISTETLFKLIASVKNKLKLDGTVGTPEELGTLFVTDKSINENLNFNPSIFNLICNK